MPCQDPLLRISCDKLSYRSTSLMRISFLSRRLIVDVVLYPTMSRMIAHRRAVPYRSYANHIAYVQCWKRYLFALHAVGTQYHQESNRNASIRKEAETIVWLICA